MRYCFIMTAATLAVFVGEAAIAAQPTPFYEGRTMRAVVGYSAGSSFDLYLRTASRHLGRHIPGNPMIVIQHMPGAGSLKAAGYLATIAPQDGSTIGMINPVNTLEPLIDPERTKFDPRKFNWLGSLNAELSTCAFWAKDIKTLDDLKRRQIVVAATGPSSGSMVDTLALKTLLGIDFKILTGYPGQTETWLAAERGEIDGFCGLLFSALRTNIRDARAAGIIAIPVQMGLIKHPALPDVPNAYDLATTDADRQLLRLIFSPWSYGRPLLAPPGVPTARTAVLRQAFNDMITDPAFRDEATRLDLEIRTLDGAAVAALVDEIFRTPPVVVEKARVLFGVGTR